MGSIWKPFRERKIPLLSNFFHILCLYLFLPTRQWSSYHLEMTGRLGRRGWPVSYLEQMTENYSDELKFNRNKEAKSQKQNEIVLQITAKKQVAKPQHSLLFW